MIKDKTELRKDGQRTLEGGMSSGRDPTLLTAQECAFASNASFRGGYPTNRQKFVKLAMTDAGALLNFMNGLFQGAAVYDIDDGQEYIMAMAGGALYQISIGGQGLTVKQTFNDGKSNPNAPQCWFCQPDIYFVVQDGTSIPIIMQGLSSIRRAGTTEVPVGQSMAYGQGRLWLAQNRQVVAGDILGGPTSVISFTEQTYIAEAAYFGVPLTSGTIVGMTFVEQGDTATGQGELLIFARNAAYSIQASVPRAAVAGVTPGWQGTPGMQRVALTNIGGTGWRNLLNVNSDVFFRSKDGWRTYRTARNEQYGWGGAPISHEMARILDYDSLNLLDYASSALFKNRVLLTAQPTPYPKNNAAAMFGGIVALDLSVISSTINKSNLAYEFSPYFAQRGSPAYDGFWQMPNGLQILQVLSRTFAHVERCFIFVYNPATAQNEIWELVDNLSYDSGQLAVVSQIETKAFDFKLPDALKMLRRGDLYFTSVAGTIQVTVEYRSDGYPFWVPWATLTLTGHQVPCSLVTAPISGATYYVSTSGSDTAAGSSIAPWRTLQHANNTVPFGSTVLVAPGTYNESPNFNRVATASSRIKFTPQSGNVFVTGQINVSGQYMTIDGLRCGMASILDSQCWLQIGGSNCVVSNCVFDTIPYAGAGNNEAVGFLIGGSHNVLLSCHVSHVDNTDCFRIFDDSNVIDGCTTYDVQNTKYSSGAHADNIQSWGGMSNCIIQNCVFQPLNLDGPKQLGILDTNPGGSTSNVHDNTFRNNIIIGGEQFFVFQQNFSFYNNIWYNSAQSIGDLFFLDQATYTGYIFKNNALYNCGTNAGNGFIQTGASGATIVDHNYFAYGSGDGPVTHDVGTNAVNGGAPGWVNPSAQDFHETPGSILINAGAALSPAFMDKDGGIRTGPWDIGPYEYGSVVSFSSPLDSAELSAQVGALAACLAPGCPSPGYWFQKRLPTPDSSCDTNTGKLFRNGFYFQCRITWQGPATLLMFILHAEELVEDPNGGCP